MKIVLNCCYFRTMLNRLFWCGGHFFTTKLKSWCEENKTIDHVVSKVSKIGKGNMDEAAGPLSGHASMIFPMEKQPLFISSGCSSKPPTCWFPEAIIFSWLATREKVVNMSTIYPLGWWMGVISIVCWLVVWLPSIFNVPRNIENNHHPNWRTPSFFRRVYNHQPDNFLVGVLRNPHENTRSEVQSKPS